MVRALGGLGLAGLEVLVIDDASPDGTGGIADRLAAELRANLGKRKTRARAAAKRTATVRQHGRPASE